MFVGVVGLVELGIMTCRLFLGLDSILVFLVEMFFLCFFCPGDLFWIKSPFNALLVPYSALPGTPLVYATTVFLVVFLCSAAKLQWAETPPMIIVLMLVISCVANGMVPLTFWTSGAYPWVSNVAGKSVNFSWAMGIQHFRGFSSTPCLITRGYHKSIFKG